MVFSFLLKQILECVNVLVLIDVKKYTVVLCMTLTVKEIHVCALQHIEITPCQ